MTKVLAGVRVIDHGAFITGPFATMLLADLGAEVIKVEQPKTGDPFRGFVGGLYGPAFQAYNRNKQSIVIDMKDEGDRNVLRELIGTADVYVQNFRPGIVEAWGLSVDELQKVNPELIYCSISGFGADGPYAHRPAYDTVAQGLSGFLGLYLKPEQPEVVGPAVADAITGLYAAYGILGALYERQTTGKGRFVEVAMVAAMSHFAVEQYHHYFKTGRTPARMDRARFSQSYALRCADGKMIGIHLSSPPKFWDALVEATGLHGLMTDERFKTRLDRARNFEALSEALQSVMETKDRAAWMPILEKAGVPFAPVYALEEALDDPQFRHLGLQVASTHPTQGEFRTIRRAIVYDRDVKDIETAAAPTLDEHGAAIRQQLELDFANEQKTTRN